MLLGWPTVVVVPIALAGGLLIGAMNGLLVVRLRVPDLLATLGMLFVLQGAQLLPSRGQSISTGVVLGGKEYTGIFTDAFLYIGRGRIGGEIPVPIVLFAFVGIVLWVVLERTRWGRMLYAIGGNPRPRGSRACASSGCDGGLHGLGPPRLARRRHPRRPHRRGRRRRRQLLPARCGGGGAGRVRRARGQRPNVLGTAVGAVFLGIMINGLTIKNFPYYTQDFVKGVVLMVALLLTFGVRRLR